MCGPVLKWEYLHVSSMKSFRLVDALSSRHFGGGGGWVYNYDTTEFKFEVQAIVYRVEFIVDLSRIVCALGEVTWIGQVFRAHNSQSRPD